MKICKLLTIGIVLLFLTSSAMAIESSVQSITEATAQQESTQSQGISDSGNVNNSGNVKDSGNLTVKDSFNSGDPIRYLPVPTNVAVSTAGGPQNFAPPEQGNGPHFMSMQVLVGILNDIDVDEAEINDDSDIEIVTQVLNSLTLTEKLTWSNVPIEFKLVSGSVKKTFPGFKSIAVVTMKADDNDTINSATLAVKLKNVAKEVGGNKVVLVSEGTTIRLSSWGVGVGFSQNYSTVNSAQEGYGGVSAGGTGWSWGESEHFKLPYLTAIIGY